jgi:RNA polymerase primary sigma factor
MRQLKITKSITNRDSESLEKYLSEIAKEEMITVEEEVQLAQRIKKGDQKALERLVKANLRFVVSVAKQYQHQGLSLPDLINEGNVGLIKAAQKFDETKGFKFISYAVWWIRQSILQAIAEQSRIVRLPLNKIGTLNKIHKAFNQLEQEFQRTPQANEISKVVDIPEDKISSTLSMSGRPVSVDAPLVEGEESSLLDLMENKDSPMADIQLVGESLKKEIQRTLATLSEKERCVIEMFYGLGKKEMSLEEIGQEIGLSRERTRQIKENALRRLQKSSRNKLLKAYLGSKILK